MTKLCQIHSNDKELDKIPDNSNKMKLLSADLGSIAGSSTACWLLLAILQCYWLPIARGNQEPQQTSQCLLDTLNQLVYKAPVERKIDRFDDLLEAFSHGFVPDLSIRSHRDAFDIYRRLRFGDPNTHLNSDSLDVVAQTLRENPKLEKEFFREYRLEIQENEFPVTPELAHFLDSQIASSGQVRSNLFQIDANSGYWKKVFQFRTQEKATLSRQTQATEKTSLRLQIKQQKEEEQIRWNQFLEEKIPYALREKLSDQSQPPKERAEILFRVLYSEWKHLISRPDIDVTSIRPISQAIIDLIHTIAYHDPLLIRALKSPNGMTRLNTYRKILDERDRFAMELGFPGHFKQVLTEIGLPSHVMTPNGIPSEIGLTETLIELEQGVSRNVTHPSTSTRSSRVWRIRSLSLTEAPFRSCLGGSDCSSRTYLTRALDPNYHYFTMTDENGFSTGQVTIVLGTGKVEERSVKIAFIDKIQNIPPSLLPNMMESLRRSVEEKGYQLAIPDDGGDQNGLSNEELIRNFVRNKIEKIQNKNVVDFKPHDHPYRFPIGFSRAEKNLTLQLIAPLAPLKGVNYSPGPSYSMWKLPSDQESINLKQITQASFDLKNSSNLTDRLRYLPAMKSILDAKLEVDPELQATTDRWISTSTEPLQLRKQALLFRLTQDQVRVSPLLKQFKTSEQIQILQNLLNTPRYREQILREKNDLAELLVIARKNMNLRKELLSFYSDEHDTLAIKIIEKLLDSNEITNLKAVKIIEEVSKILGKADLEDFIKIEELLHGTNLESWIKKENISSYVSSIHHQDSLRKILARCFTPTNGRDPEYLDFGQRLYHAIKTSGLDQSKIILSFNSILNIQKNSSQKLSFSEAASLWLKNSKIDPELKLEFLLSHFELQGPHKQSWFSIYENQLKPEEVERLNKLLQKKTNLQIFQKLSNDSQIDLFRLGKLESFEFRPFHFSNTKNQNQIQATPVTQLQWTLVMGNNPSRFKSNMRIVKILDQEIEMSPNRRVEQVSWEDIQKFVARLNELDPKFHYRLPTEAEWEHVIRSAEEPHASNESNFNELSPPGVDSGDPDQYTQEVASHAPNSYGIYDYQGNIWEWMQTAWDSSASGNIFESKNLPNMKRRVLLGGCSHGGVQTECVIPRANSNPQERYSTVGFRLVRIQK